MINRRTFVGMGAATAAGALQLGAQIKPPKKASELVITMNSGEQLLLSGFKGKVVVLEFLLTTCPHCQRCSGVMQKLYSDMGGAFQPLGAAVNPEDMSQARMLIPQYIYSLGLKFPVGWTKKEMAYNWLEVDPIKQTQYFPQLAIIDKKGFVRAYHPGTDQEFFKDEETNIRKTVEVLLKESPGASTATKKGV